MEVIDNYTTAANWNRKNCELGDTEAKAAKEIGRSFSKLFTNAFTYRNLKTTINVGIFIGLRDGNL